jgi:hypothetical protein
MGTCELPCGCESSMLELFEKRTGATAVRQSTMMISESSISVAGAFASCVLVRGTAA